MSIKFANIAKFFFRTSSEVPTERKSGQAKVFGLFSRKPDRTDSSESGSFLTRFFARFFGSSGKARKATETAFPERTQREAAVHHVKLPGVASANELPNVYDPHLQLPFPPEMSAEERWRSVEVNTFTPQYLNLSDADAERPAPSFMNQMTEAPTDNSELITTSTQFIRSSAGRFHVDLADMATLIENTQGHSRTPSRGSPAETLTHAFQIYYEEEGELVDPDKLVSPDWRQRKTANAPEDLKTLSENLQKIPTNNQRDQELIQKAAVTIQRRIDRISSDLTKNKTPGP